MGLSLTRPLGATKADQYPALLTSRCPSLKGSSGSGALGAEAWLPQLRAASYTLKALMEQAFQPGPRGIAPQQKPQFPNFSLPGPSAGSLPPTPPLNSTTFLKVLPLKQTAVIK